MGEREEAAESEAGDEVGPSGAGAAIAMALGRLRPGAKLAPEAAAYLKEQTRLARLQAEHLKEQEKHQRLRYFGDRLRIGLQLLGIGFGLAIAVVIAAAAWNAHEDHGVAIDAFSVPPDLASRGLTGQVAASQLLDRLAEMQAKTVTTRPASTYANDWGGDIKVEIPETGVSIGELNRYLRQWLGSETRISGEIVRTPAGLAVTARAGDAPGRRFEGAEADVDRLIGQAAEAVYAQTQRYRYAVYLQSVGRGAEAEQAYARLARSGPREDRPWALAGWGSLLLQRGDLAGAAEKGRAAIREAPGLGVGYPPAYTAETFLRHSEAALQIARFAKTHQRLFPADIVLGNGLGDYRASLAAIPTAASGFSSAEGVAEFIPFDGVRLVDLANDHEISRALAIETSHMAHDPTGWVIALGAAEDWAGVVRTFEGIKGGPRNNFNVQAAVAYAMVGRLADAHALVDPTGLDCDDCIIARGRIAAAEDDWTAAGRWFAQATRQAPSIPFAPTEWGRALLAKGELDAAIGQLKEAHRRGPHYADPLELWGEALMRKGDYAGAIAKFTEADKYAPRWGRNHLRWGEALLRSGRYREARAQFEAAGGMDQTRPDRAALDVFLARTARGPLHG
jgi:tetratricopeptide (TPR) repeat protein